MARLTELINILDSDNEPLPKRLKLANCAFKSTTLPIHFKEIHLLKWLIKLAENGNNDILQTVNDWLRSDEVTNISKADVSQDDVFEILQILISIISCENKDTDEPKIIESFLYVTSNKIFQQYFKHDLKLYFKLVCQLINHIKDSTQLLQVLDSDTLSNKLYFTEAKYFKYFYKICVPSLGQSMDGAQNDIKNGIIQLVGKCLFQKHLKQHEEYLKTIFHQHNTSDDLSISKGLIRAICDYYNNRNLSAICVVYSSLSSVFESKFGVVYEFTLLMLQICGFDIQEKYQVNVDFKDCNYCINFSIDVLSTIFNVLATVKCSSDDKINDINFSMTAQLLLSTLVCISDSSETIFKIFRNAINAEPLILEPMISTSVPYIIFSNTNENVEEYKKLLITIVNISTKLYRLPNLIAKMLLSIKNYPGAGNLEMDIFNFKGKPETKPTIRDCVIESTMPQEILDCFSTHILDLPSWQVINILKTFIYHLKIVSDDLKETSADELNQTYIEILSTLFCTFLSSVRIVEHTTPDLVVNKFVRCMLDLKDILQVLGNRLLDLNHNQYIMRAYLNICYMWGELSILLNFYSSASDVSNLRSNNRHYQVCCTSYIHSYLTAEQWCSVTERITNFGEKPCKNVMQSLQLQSIKAIYLFENRKDDVGVLFSRNLMQNPSLESLLKDQFVIKVVTPEVQNMYSSLAKEFIKRALHGEKDIFRCSALESSEVTREIVFNILIKILKFGKPKEGNIVDAKELLTALFQKKTENILSNVSAHYNGFRAHFNEQNLNENKLNDYLNLLQQLPITSLNSNIQLIIFLCFSTLLEHLRNKDVHVKYSIENFIIGLIQVPSDMLSSLQAKYIVSFMVNNITDYKTVFVYWLENMTRNSSNFMNKFVSLVKYLLKHFESDSKIRTCVVQLLNNLNKNKKHKLHLQFKNEINEYRDKIYESAIEWLSSNKENTEEVLSFYTLALKHCLSTDNDLKNGLKQNLDKYVQMAMVDIQKSNGEASLLLFSTTLIHKKQLAIVDDQLILNIWNAVRTLEVKNELRKEFSQLIVLIFEHISNENFTIICADLNKIALSSLGKDHNAHFDKVMIAINGILQCSLNPIKLKVWQNKVEVMLAEFVNSLTKNENISFREQVLSFETNIIQANHFMITAPMVDEIFRSIILMFSISSKQMTDVYRPCVQMLNLLLKHRMPLITDRLPSFLQQYRTLLINVCKASDSSLNLPVSKVEDLADCAHQLEKLTNLIVTCGRHVQRIATYVVADILQQYESVSMYSSIKMHIDNCVYALMSLFDQHAISFLMRSLSTASTELFKYMHSNYRRYYKFTGKV